MKLILSLCYLVTMLHSIAGVFSVPDGWIDLPAEISDKPDIESVESFSSPNGWVRVILTQSKQPISTVGEAEVLIEGIGEMLRLSGGQLDSRDEIHFEFFDGIHVKGEMKDLGASTSYLFDSYSIFTNTTVINAMVMVDSRYGKRKDVDWLLSRLNISAGPIRLSKVAGGIDSQGNSTEPKENFMYFWGKVLGWVIVCGLIIVFVVLAILRSKRRDPRAIAMKAYKAQQHANDDLY